MTRDRWGSRGAFIMAAVGSAVGLGNIWRFPYVAYQNGGGAFLIPYFVALLTAGIPLMILEYGLGAKLQGSAPKALHKINKRWEWIGWFALSIGFIICTYYSAVMSWCWNYLWDSFSSILPWGKTASSVSNHFYVNTLNLSENPGQITCLPIHLLIGLALTWILIWLIIHKGVSRVGKVVMITVPLPIVMLLILLIRGLTLPNAAQGLNFYLEPTWSKLLEPNVWLAAYGQVFFSLSLGFGILIAYASYLRKKAEITNNAFITSFANCGTSFLAGFAVFSILGFFAMAANMPIQDVVKGGPGLAFEVYPAAIANMPTGAPVFAVIFFIALLTLGIDSAFSLVEAVASGLHDKFRLSKGQVATITCVVGFLCSLWFITDAGLLWLDIIDHWMNNFGLVTVGFLECIIVGWLWKRKKFRESINEVSEIKIGVWWDVLIMFVTPVILLVSFILTAYKLLKEPYGGYSQGYLMIGGWGLFAALIVIAVLISRIKGKTHEWLEEEDKQE